jgi:hypothetical protein
MSAPQEFALGHGLTSISAPTLNDARRYCAFLAAEIRHRHDRDVALGNAPSSVELWDAAVLDLAARVLETVEEHEAVVRDAVKADKKRIADEAWAAAAREERIKAAIAARRKEAANG